MSGTVRTHIAQLCLHPIFIGQALFKLRRTKAFKSYKDNASILFIYVLQVTHHQ